MCHPSSAWGRAAAAVLALVAVLIVSAPARAGDVTHFDFVYFLDAGDTGIPRNGEPWKSVLIGAFDDQDQQQDCFDHTVTYSDPDSIVTPSHNFGAAIVLSIFCPFMNGYDWTFSLTPLKPGLHHLTVTDINRPSIRSVLAFNVDPGPVTKLEIAPVHPTAILGDAAAFKVVARDKLGFLATNDSRQLSVTITGTGGTAPTQTTLTGGTGTISAKFGTAGTQWMTVTDPANPALTAMASITVQPAPYFEIQLPDSWTILAGQPVQVLYCAKNADGTPNTAYHGTVHWSGSDTKADYPADYTMGPTQQGCLAPLLTFATAGDQTITAIDTANPNITGSATHAVYGGDVEALEFAGVPSTITAGPLTVTANVFDAWGNPASAAPVVFQCDDPTATWPAGVFSFRVSDYGTHKFQFTLPAARFTTCTAAYGYYGHTKTARFSVNVQPGGSGGGGGGPGPNGGGAHYYVSEFASPRHAGAPGSIRVTVADAYGNRLASYRSRVHFTSSDPRASLPADYTFTEADSGSHVFDALVLRTPGRQSVTIADLHTAAITGGVTGIAVTAGPFAKLTLSGLVAIPHAGAIGNLRVTASDADGNRLSSYRGTVHFTSSDAAAKLPPDYTFTAADAGTHVFSGVAFGTGGLQWIRATDVVAGRGGDIRLRVAKELAGR